MAWDTERTRSRLLDAAVTEFSAHGLAGARVDRISTRAGVNKERIYQYFGNKQGLFDAVAESALVRVMDLVPLDGSGVDALADYAGRLFDHHAAHPEAARLWFWEGLERGSEVIGLPERARRSASKALAVQELLPGIGRAAAGELLLTVVTLCSAWPTLPQLDRLLVDGDGDRRASRRAAVVELTRLLAQRAVDEAAAG